MPKPNQQSFPKWLITVPLLFLALVSMLLALPITLPLTLLLSIIPGYRGAVRTLAFFLCYLACELAGVFACSWISLRHARSSDRFQAANFKLQCWWAYSLWNAAKHIFSLSFHTHGAEALDGPGAILLPRHTSIADTVLPMVYYAIPQGRRLRYVLKTELQWDPCLEIVGHRLPNYFITRGATDSAAELAGLANLLREAPAAEGLLLYPEGTRYSPKKHAALQEKSQDNPELSAQLRRWKDLLPPRLGGYQALLEANTQHDLLFMAHVGFGGSSSFGQLINNRWAHSEVHMEFWRVPFADIPQDAEQRREFLFTQWDRMQQTVEQLKLLGD